MLRAAALPPLLLLLLCSVPTSGQQFRGVNLGGWLVIESWIYPQWYAQFGIEPDIGEGPFIEAFRNTGRDPLPALYNRWSTWLTYQDLENLRNAGITHVRIPARSN